MKNTIICIYDQRDNDLLVHQVDTLEKAAAWIGCTVRSLYKSMQLYGVMQSKNYTVERVTL